MALSLVLFLTVLGLTKGSNSDKDIREHSAQILALLRNPLDSYLQNEIKGVVATYLAETTLAEEEADGKYLDEPIAYGKHNQHTQASQDRYNELLQKLQDQEKQLLEIKRKQAEDELLQKIQQQEKELQELKQKQGGAEAASSSNAVKQETIPALVTAAPVSKLEPIVTAVPIVAAATVRATTEVPVIPAAGRTTPPTPATTPRSPRPTVDPVHHANQVNKILGNVANGNIVGIVDESLAIRAPTPVRNLVTNIMKVIFCNPIDRLLQRCAPNQVDAANNSVKG